jgi:hypothetical protein
MKTLEEVQRDIGDRLHVTYPRDQETVVQITRDMHSTFWCVYVDKPHDGMTVDEWADHCNDGGSCGDEQASWARLDALTLQAILVHVFSGEPLLNVLE